MANFLFLNRDGLLLLSTRAIRLFAYGLLAVTLVLYLSEVGLTLTQIGSLMTLTLIGDAVISLWLTTQADRIGRRRMLIILDSVLKNLKVKTTYIAKRSLAPAVPGSVLDI